MQQNAFQQHFCAHKFTWDLIGIFKFNWLIAWNTKIFPTPNFYLNFSALSRWKIILFVVFPSEKFFIFSNNNKIRLSRKFHLIINVCLITKNETEVEKKKLFNFHLWAFHFHSVDFFLFSLPFFFRFNVWKLIGKLFFYFNSNSFTLNEKKMQYKNLKNKLIKVQFLKVARSNS